jgi:hypothetical protein
MQNFPLTVLKIFQIHFEDFPRTLAKLTTFHSLTNTKSEHFNHYRGSARLKVNYLNFNYKSALFFPLTSTMAENQYTPIQQTKAEITFHDTIQQRSRPLSPSTSVTSQTEPTNLFPTIELLSRHLGKRGKGAKHSNAQA